MHSTYLISQQAEITPSNSGLSEDLADRIKTFAIVLQTRMIPWLAYSDAILALEAGWESTSKCKGNVWYSCDDQGWKTATEWLGGCSNKLCRNEYSVRFWRILDKTQEAREVLPFLDKHLRSPTPDFTSANRAKPDQLA